MMLPKQPKEGEPVKHFAKEVINWMRANTLNHVKGGRVKRSPNGTTVEVIQDGGINIGDLVDLVTSHPWKVTAGADGSVNIAAGYVMGYYMNYGASEWGSLTSAVINSDDSAASQTLAAGFYYEGGNQAVAGTKFIYAEIIRNFPLVYAESGADNGVDYTEVELGNNTNPPAYDEETLDVTGAAVIVLSDDPPNIYETTSGYSAVLVAKVVNIEGVISVTQYLTHNPTIFVPVIKITTSPSI